MNEYKTIAGQASDVFVERRSRFIGTIAPVTTPDEAMAFVASMRTEHWDANHNVYAYILREGQLSRYSDDGEPSGTAGVPVLSVLQNEGLVDIVCVVTRYFGGVKLGAGGLVRAYSHGAKIAVDAADVKYMVPCTFFSITAPYKDHDRVMYLLTQYRHILRDTAYTDNVTITAALRSDEIEGFALGLRELLGGKEQLATLGEEFYPL